MTAKKKALIEDIETLQDLLGSDGVPADEKAAYQEELKALNKELVECDAAPPKEEEPKPKATKRKGGILNRRKKTASTPSKPKTATKAKSKSTPKAKTAPESKPTATKTKSKPKPKPKAKAPKKKLIPLLKRNPRIGHCTWTLAHGGRERLTLEEVEALKAKVKKDKKYDVAFLTQKKAGGRALYFKKR